jgi:hypothetical protein
MPQTISNMETRRAYALLTALNAREITLNEFADGLLPLPSEVLQILATALALHSVNEPVNDSIRTAWTLCGKLAANERVYS